ncbi:MAG TPA: hypothetical protein VMU31_05285 [Rhizomicrobium sp.]|nr:hypothetical protein [Rhizomicrobium sp.]
MLPSLDRRTFINSLGGAAAVAAMTHEARADALEDALGQKLGLGKPGETADMHAESDSMKGVAPPTVAQIEAEITTRPYRRGVGGNFVNTRGNVTRLEPLPAKPTLTDFYIHRFNTNQHCLQSANKAMQSGADEEIILACFLHDTVQALVKTDHGWWGAQMYAPYVSERTAWAIRYHQALRFYPDEKAGYIYPDLYRHTFGVDYVPPPHIEAAYKYAKGHKWYGAARAVTVNDLYAFDSSKKIKMDPFMDIVGRHFKNPPEGLGNDNSPSAHMWRTLNYPDTPL